MARVYEGLDVGSDFGGRFPWKSRRIELPDKNKMAVVDEGPRDAPLTFLCLHGNPTWGYLYREFIRRLSQTYRVVVPDMIGFGRSDKPRDPAYYSLQRHIANLEFVAERLKVQNVVPVVQDWGGPVGMGYATRHPEKIAGVVVLNTWAFASEDGGVRLPWLFRRLVLGKGGWKRSTQNNMFTETFLVRPHNLTEEAATPYRAPHPTPQDRVGIARFPHMIPAAGDMDHPEYATMRDIEERLAWLALKPAIIVWAMKDVAFRKPQLDRWKRVFRQHAGPFALPDAKHYLPEDHSDEILSHVEPWAKRLLAVPEPPKPKKASRKRA